MNGQLSLFRGVKYNTNESIYSFPCVYPTSLMYLYEAFPKYNKENHQKDLEKSQDSGGGGGSKYF